MTDYVNVWEQPEHLEKIHITDAFEAAAEELQNLKSQADVTVCIYHGGYECDLDNGMVLSTSGENVGCRILKELDYDILLTAHQHMSVPGRDLFGTHTLQLAPNAAQYACLDIRLDNGKVSVKSSICCRGGSWERALRVSASSGGSGTGMAGCGHRPLKGAGSGKEQA